MPEVNVLDSVQKASFLPKAPLTTKYLPKVPLTTKYLPKVPLTNFRANLEEISGPVIKLCSTFLERCGKWELRNLVHY